MMIFHSYVSVPGGNAQTLHIWYIYLHLEMFGINVDESMFQHHGANGIYYYINILHVIGISEISIDGFSRGLFIRNRGLQMVLAVCGKTNRCTR